MSHRSDVATDTQRYRHVETYRVRYDDLDTYRHVNNKAFLSYVEDARVQYLVEGAGFSHHHNAINGVMVVHAAIDYLSQIQPFETVRVYTRTADIGTKSITLHHLVVAIAAEPEAPERVAATSTTVLASVDLTTNTSHPNDPEMLARIRAYEPTPPD